MYTYEEWYEFNQKKGTSTSMVGSPEWLLKGCPKCGGKEWQVTNDGWCYCDECGKGYTTDGIWVNAPLVHWNENGFSCFMCKGTGKTRGGEECDVCDRRFT
jgi:hypothetical protein